MKKGREFDYSKYPNWIDPAEVKPYERNAKFHDDKQVQNIANSIHRFGWQQDTVITKDGVLVIGHGRRLAAIRLGCKMPYHIVDKEADQLTDEEIRILRIADNKTAETAIDFGTMTDAMKYIPDIDMEQFGFAGGDIVSAYNEEKTQRPEKNTERIIITYLPEDDDAVKRLLQINDEKIKPVYTFDELVGKDS